MIGRFKNKGTLVKYLISYIIVFLLPILFLLSYFYPRSSNIIQSNAIENANGMLTQTVDNINMQLGNFWNYPYALHNNNNLNHQLFSNNNSVNTYTIMKEMEKIFGYNSFIQKAILYNKKTGMFYSFPGSYTREDFNTMNGSFYFPNWDKEIMLTELNEMKEFSIRPVDHVIVSNNWNTSYRALTFMLPVPYRNLYSYGVLMLIVPESNFFPKQNKLDEVQHHIFVLDKNNKLLATSTDQVVFDVNYFKDLLSKDNNHNSDIIAISGEDYLVNVRHSHLFDLRIFGLISLKDVNKEINQLKMITISLIILILIIGIIVIFFLTRTNYMPIRLLRKKALELVDKESNAKLNELEIVSFAFDSIQQENRELVSKVMLNKNISLEYFLIQFLNGTLMTSDLIQQASEHGVHLKGNVCCITFYAEDRNIVKLLADIKGILDLGQEIENVFSYLVKGMRHEDFILILSFDDENQMKEYFYKLYQLEQSVKIGIGAFEKVDLLNNSYTYSLAALEAAKFNETNNVMEYSDLEVKDSDILRQLFSIIEIIEFSIASSDRKQFNEQFNILIHLMQTKVKRISTLKMIFINIYNVMAKELNKNGLNIKYYYDITDKKANIEELEQILRKTSEHLEEILEENNASRNIKKILSFIDMNYMDVNISMQSLADEFNMSYSNFSHYFKNNTNENLSSYLAELRVNKAKELLIESDLAIKLVAKHVGYVNANSFTRTFKRIVNITPGEYRKVHKK